MCVGFAMTGDEKKWNKLSFWAWTIGLAFALVIDIIKYQENLNRQKKARGKETELAQLRKEQTELKFAMIR